VILVGWPPSVRRVLRVSVTALGNFTIHDGLRKAAMSSASRPFRVVTHRTWLYEQLSRGVPAVQDFGFDIDPATAPEGLWWAPGEWVARAHAAGVRLPLLSAGPQWLELLSCIGREEYCGGRTVRAARAVNLCAPQRPFFAKLAEAKTDAMPARVYESKKDFFAARLAACVPWDAWINTSSLVDYVSEARFFIAHRKITAASVYLHRGKEWGDISPGDSEAAGARIKLYPFINELLRDQRVAMPPGLVIDAGVDSAGRCSVIEANASWSSNPYGCNTPGVVESIAAAHDFAGEYPEWAWQIDAVHANARPLRIATAVGRQR
jgi:hypothetical protein